ncbi:MAG: aldolase/citrate lyase family protein [bacterium]|nr:aldolase/citrate lyase family protein [bacterium]
MRSFLFIPANKPDFIKKSVGLKASNFIIDLEDAIYNSKVEQSVNNILDLKPSLDYYIRLSYNPEEKIEQFSYAEKLLKKGYGRFVIPKIKSQSDISSIESFLVNNLKATRKIDLIVLIENPVALANLANILQSDSVIGVGLGSHDYCDSIGMTHTMENLYWARMQILNTGKALGKFVIDIASMNLSDKNSFIEECKDGHEKGFDAKFLIHPWQLNIFDSLRYYSKEELIQALHVKEYIDDIGGLNKFTIANIGGVVIEKAHLKRINKILLNYGYETF